MFLGETLYAFSNIEYKIFILHDCTTLNAIFTIVFADPVP